MDEEKAYDITILGASGFTGKYVIREALKQLNTPNSSFKSLALAGRSTSKLAESLRWAARPNPPPQIPLLAANTDDPSSLLRIASLSKLILNCMGPFRLHGEGVVRACVQMGCDYLDICGEPEFMERTECLFGEEAGGRGSLVVSGCGFDSVPAELGWMFNSRMWGEGGRGLNRVEAYLSLESDKRMVFNFGTYESAVLWLANQGELAELRRSRPRLRRPVVSSLI